MTNLSADIGVPDLDAISPCLEEAIRALGYVTFDAKEELANLLASQFGQHPHQIALSYRKAGEQMTSDEKRSCGVKPHAFLSRHAFFRLTSKGRGQPIHALDVTLLRAMFSFFRARTIQQALPVAYAYLKCISLHSDCRKCASLNGLRVQPSETNPYPPNGCEREACSLGFVLHIDFIERAAVEIRNASDLPSES